jgi:hypothetical protein
VQKGEITVKRVFRGSKNWCIMGRRKIGIISGGEGGYCKISRTIYRPLPNYPAPTPNKNLPIVCLWKLRYYIVSIAIFSLHRSHYLAGFGSNSAEPWSVGMSVLLNKPNSTYI